MNDEVSRREQALFLALHGGTVPSNPFGWFFLRPPGVSSFPDQDASEHLGGLSAEFSLLVAPSSLGTLSRELCLLHLLNSEPAGRCLGSPSSLQPVIAPQVAGGGTKGLTTFVSHL